MLFFKSFLILLILIFKANPLFAKRLCQRGETIGVDCELAYVLFSANQSWHTPVYRLQRGSRYKFTTRLSADWSDAGIRADLKGWTQLKPLAAVYSTLRRSLSLGFYQIGFCDTRRYKNCRALDRSVVTDKASTSSKIHIFVNDVPGYAFNNRGMAFIQIEKVR